MKQLFSRVIFGLFLLISSTAHSYELENNPNDPFLKCGDHVIVECFGCTNTNNFTELPNILRQAAQAAGATVLSIKTHKFEPKGMTGVAVLSESHISIHTWPEYGYVAIDTFTCGIHVDVLKAVEVLKNFFAPTNSTVRILNRGLEKKDIQEDHS